MKVVALAPSAPAGPPAGRWAAVVRMHRRRPRWDRGNWMPPRPRSIQPATRAAAISRSLLAIDAAPRKAKVAVVRTDRNRIGLQRWSATQRPPIAPAVARQTARAAAVQIGRAHV